MKKKNINSIKKEVSPIIFGTLTMGFRQKNLSIDDGANLLLHAFNNGINIIDTAQYYETYEYIRTALERFKEANPKGKTPIISTKSLARDAEGMKLDIKEALKSMNVKYIDVFLLHEVTSIADFKLRKRAWDVLKDYKARGIIGAIGVSTHHVDVTYKMSKIPSCDIVFSLINLNSLGIRYEEHAGTKEEMEYAIKKCQEAGKDVYTMKVFGGGNLVKDYVSCMDYATNIPGSFGVAIGFATFEEINMAIDYFNGTLPKTYSPDTSKKKMFVETDDCTGCGACIQKCTSKAISFDQNGSAFIDNSKCLKCNYCAPVCPVRAIILL